MNVNATVTAEVFLEAHECHRLAADLHRFFGDLEYIAILDRVAQHHCHVTRARPRE